MLKTIAGAVIGEVIDAKAAMACLARGLALSPRALQHALFPACCSSAAHLRPKACMTKARNASVADPLSSITNRASLLTRA
jgi:hypothetical protein